MTPGRLPKPRQLAGVDLDRHRRRAVAVLAMHIGQNLAAPPSVWEQKAEALLDALARHGIAAIWLGDPAFAVAAADPLQGGPMQDIAAAAMQRRLEP